MSDTASSAVALSEPERGQSPNTSSLKRRRSEAEEQDSKKQRTSPGKSLPDSPQDARVAETAALEEAPKSIAEPSKAAQSEDTRDSRRKNSTAAEKQRSKRLFGALLGNLNQPSDRVSKKRAEIEHRRKAELQKQDDEHREDNLRRLQKLAERRQKEQVKLDEENMYLRHRDMLDKANFLQTETEPIIYYRPWELLPHQEDIIDDQIRDVKIQIDRELAELRRHKKGQSAQDGEDEHPDKGDSRGRLARRSDGVPLPAPEGDIQETSSVVDGNPPALSANDSILNQSGSTPSGDPVSAPEPVADDKPSPEHALQCGLQPSSGDINPLSVASVDAENLQESKNGKKDDSEDDGDHIVEGDEDTVIY